MNLLEYYESRKHNEAKLSGVGAVDGGARLPSVSRNNGGRGVSQTISRVVNGVLHGARKEGTNGSFEYCDSTYGG